MAFKLRDVAALAGYALTAAGLAYSAGEVVGMRRFRSRPARPVQAQPAVTILKPLHGDEPQLYENLRSFCKQSYPRYQVIFGSRDERDPALEVARRLVREFPDVDLCVVAGGPAPHCANPKVENLQGMIGQAKHGILVVADSDIRVGADYLSAVAGAFADPDVGAATCLYAGVPSEGYIPELGAAILNERFMPSVLVALMIEPLEYCFGATMAVRRDVLDTVGGFAALGAHIADDFMLGKLVTGAGFKVALCPYVVRMTVADADIETLWSHHLRWQRTVLAARPRGFAGSLITYNVPLAAISALLTGAPVARAMLAAAIVARVVVHGEARKTFAPEVELSPWLIPAADAFAFATWLGAFFTKEVTWRGDRFTIAADGRLDVSS
ncbi:MAG TPA: bacteriohopanetetrol glucosamine biosynthesis glycosyltransferase HpnI [Candidatus Rubrimentiphilum sp.]|nr:bacteriohopanetetrol glucosamine biosynthesis glycosyltransferase HpnI [Candidatus Rubrimentiphilum sp.]